MTALAEAFGRKGVTPIHAEAWLFVAKWRNHGQSKAVLLAIIERGYENQDETGDEGREHYARSGQAGDADVSDGRGHPAVADEATCRVPRPPHSAPAPIREGLSTRADQAINVVPSRPPPNPPRGLSAIASVNETMAKSMFDIITLPDGRRLRDVRWNEAPVLAQKYRRIAHILIAVHNHAIPPDPSATLDSIVSEADLKTIVEKAEEANNA